MTWLLEIDWKLFEECKGEQASFIDVNKSILFNNEEEDDDEHVESWEKRKGTKTFNSANYCYN